MRVPLPPSGAKKPGVLREVMPARLGRSGRVVAQVSCTTEPGDAQVVVRSSRTQPGLVTAG